MKLRLSYLEMKNGVSKVYKCMIDVYISPVERCQKSKCESNIVESRAR